MAISVVTPVNLCAAYFDSNIINVCIDDADNHLSMICNTNIYHINVMCYLYTKALEINEFQFVVCVCLTAKLTPHTLVSGLVSSLNLRITHKFMLHSKTPIFATTSHLLLTSDLVSQSINLSDCICDFFHSNWIAIWHFLKLMTSIPLQLKYNEDGHSILMDFNRQESIIFKMFPLYCSMLQFSILLMGVFRRWNCNIMHHEWFIYSDWTKLFRVWFNHLL